MSSDFEIKLVDLTNGGGTGFYYIPAAQMPVNQWVTVDIPMSSFRGNDSMTGGPIAADHNIDQLVVKPMNNFDPTVNGPERPLHGRHVLLWIGYWCGYGYRYCQVSIRV